MPTKTTRLGAPLSLQHERALERALAPMVAQARATAARVTTAAQARALGAALRKAWPDSRIRDLLAKAGAGTEAAASRPWGTLARADGRGRSDAASCRTDAAPPEYDGRKLITAWSKEAAALITSVRNEVAEGLRRDVVAALEAGTDPSELAERWRARGIPVEWGTLEGRVRVIARHQTAILHARVQRERARSVGVTHFVWRTQGDDRVRDRHRALDGQRVPYAGGAKGEGLPGEPVNCRCWAESIIERDVAERALTVRAATTPGDQPRRTAAVARGRERLAAARAAGAPRPKLPPRRGSARSASTAKASPEGRLQAAMRGESVASEPLIRTLETTNIVGPVFEDAARFGMRPLTTHMAGYEGATPEQVQQIAAGLRPTMSSGSRFDPVQLVDNGSEAAAEGFPRWVIRDGRHRIAAARQAGATHVHAIVISPEGKQSKAFVRIR